MRKVLVVDESRAVLDEMTRLAEHPNVRILQAENADQALELHAVERMDLMFVARAMPETDGLDLCRILRADAELRHVSLVVVGRAPEDESLARDAGANAFVRWPVTRGEVLRTLIKFLNVAPRKSVTVPVQMQLLGMSDDDPFDAVTINVSTSGMLAESTQPVEIGSTLVCHFMLPETEVPLLFTAEVVRRAPASAPERHAYGVRFLRTDSNGLSALERFVGSP